ncbi:MAG: tRNA (adenosine(37)-N6)-dimethylallyltransferase MiaA [Firmicutes bacterium]|nr:tRNA (adenosine(37)-N6)-dimethylallyltransferase MiaA [Bacillota bacterium]
MKGVHPILVIVGPTAVGKTELAVQVAKEVDGEIISADSMQVYRGLDIGTAKPTESERQGVPHHLLDIVDPGEEFSVADYQAMVEEVLADLAKRNKTPILTGGTGLYIQAVLQGYVFSPEGKDPVLRAELEQKAESEGNKVLHRQLSEVDPETAMRLHPNDRRRIIRALEVFYSTGRPLSEHLKMQQERGPRHRSVKFGLIRSRARLYERINARVDLMMEAGLLEEVKSLLQQGLDDDSTAIQALGYKELAGFLRGQYDLDEAIRLLKRDTRRYAKRQLTWFRRDQEIVWLDLDRLSTRDAVHKIAAIYWRNFHTEKEI